MRGITKRETVVGTRVRSRMGLFLGTIALFWSAQLLGKDESLAAGRRDEREDAPRHVLVISIPDRKLAVTEEGRVLKVYPVAVGATVSPSPTGTMKIVNKVIGPTYSHQGKVIPPGKSNPLGDRWMGLSQKGYGIHGTNVPTSIGKAASHGCIRMGKHDVEELFNLARVGDVVEIHGERDAQVAEIFDNPAAVVPSSVRPPTPVSTQIATRRATELSPVVIAAMAEEAGSRE
ncbi:MAG TPA: L,D-transpeptidase [Terriglobia bacterium]|nr:L,D-transpeptidase [Terriglobia bacterium]